MINNFFKNLTKTKRSRHSSRVKFIVNLIVGLIVLGLIVYSLIAVYAVSRESPLKPYRTSWIGNTFSGGSKWVQNFIDGMYVAPDGTIYTNSVWDEGAKEAGIYKNKDAIGANDSQLHGSGRSGGVAVTASSKYLYVSMKQAAFDKPGQDYPPSGTTWYAVRRYTLSGVPAPFAGGRGYDQSMLIVSKSGDVTGLANAGNELYVSDSAQERIRVYNTNTMREVRSWSFARPQEITVDKLGNLWIIQAKHASNPAMILRYSKTGKLLPQKITNVVEPTALAVDNQGRLLVADNGPRLSQVLIYHIRQRPKLVGTFGTQGGIYSGTRGRVGEKKFYGITGVGADSSGNIYVNSNGFNSSGTDLRKFSAAGVLQWQLLGLEFVDSADADPGTNAVDVFTKHEHFVMDYSKGSGQEWTYIGYTLDRFRYPDDPRLHGDQTSITSPFVRRINGKRFLYLTNMWADSLSIYRFDGEIAVPSGMFAKKHLSWLTKHPATGSWLWRDRNGDGSIQSNEHESLGAEDDSVWGWEVDSKGDIWQASESGGIRHYRVQGLDAYGSPIYSGAGAEVIPMPPPFNKVYRLKYVPQTDVMYIGGYTDERPQTGKEWGKLGTEIVRYDNWKTKRKVRWRVALPYDPAADPVKHIKAMDVAGNRVFAVDFKTAAVYVYDAATGAFVRKLTPGPEVKSESGQIDIPYALRAFKRANGEYLVFVEEDAKAKVIMYRLAG